MTYQYVDSCRSGMVRTRARHAGPLGSVWTAKDCVINRAAEIEKRKKFVPVATLPTQQTFGGYKYAGQFYVFGSAADVTVPDGYTYQRLQNPNGALMSGILDVEPFFGALYVIAQYNDGSVHHFFDGERVTDWDQLTTHYGSLSDLATAFAAKINGGTRFSAIAQSNTLDINGFGGVEFTLEATGVNGGQADDQSAAVNELVTLGAVVPAVSATGSFDVTSGTLGASGATAGNIVCNFALSTCSVSSITVSGVQLLPRPLEISEAFPGELAGLEMLAVANGLAALINEYSATSGFTAVWDGNTGLDIYSASGLYNGVVPSATSLGCNLVISPLAASLPTNYMSQISVGAVNLLAGNVPYGASTGATASALADAINANTPASGFTASVASSTVTLTAPPSAGASVNTLSPTRTVAGSFVTGAVVAFSGGVDGSVSAQQKQRVTFDGTFEIKDIWTVKLNGTPYKLTGTALQPGKTALTFKKKVYSNAQSVIVFSAIRDATNFVGGIGAGYLNASGEKYGDAEITTLAEYAGDMAVFTKQTIYVFNMNEDEDLNQLLYTVEGVGNIAPKTVQAFGQRDVFFLAWSGIRSLRSHYATDRAFVSDVGTPIDPFIQDWMRQQTAMVLERSKSAIEPSSGRYIASIGTRAFVFNYFPDEKISAWTYWDLPSEPRAWFRDEKTLYVRFGDIIYAYGGEDGTTEAEDDDEFEAVVETHFFDAKQPAHEKNFDDLDGGFVGEWEISVIPNPNQEDEEVDVGAFFDITYNAGDHAFDQRTSHIALVLRCAKAGAAKITDYTLGYNGATEQN